MDGSVFEEKQSFKVMGLSFSTKSDWGSHIISTVKTASKKNQRLDSFCEVHFS